MTTLAQALIEAVKEQIDTEGMTPERERAVTGAISSAIAATGYNASMGLTFYALTDPECDRLAQLLVHHLHVSPLSTDYDAALQAMQAATRQLKAACESASAVARV